MFSFVHEGKDDAGSVSARRFLGYFLIRFDSEKHDHIKKRKLFTSNYFCFASCTSTSFVNEFVFFFFFLHKKLVFAFFFIYLFLFFYVYLLLCLQNHLFFIMFVGQTRQSNVRHLIMWHRKKLMPENRNDRINKPIQAMHTLPFPYMHRTQQHRDLFDLMFACNLNQSKFKPSHLPFASTRRRIV